MVLLCQQLPSRPPEKSPGLPSSIDPKTQIEPVALYLCRRLLVEPFSNVLFNILIPFCEFLKALRNADDMSWILVPFT